MFHSSRRNGSLQQQREHANAKEAARLDERYRRQQQNRQGEQDGDINEGLRAESIGEKRQRYFEHFSEDGGDKRGGQKDEYGSLRLGSSAKTFVSTAGQNGFVCVLCNVTLPSRELYQQHLSGPAHAKAERQKAEELDRLRRGIGKANDALAAARWNANSGDIIISNHDARYQDGESGRREVQIQKVGRPVEQTSEEIPALPKHISSFRNTIELDEDYSIDGWVPPLPSVVGIDEEVLLGDLMKNSKERTSSVKEITKEETVRGPGTQEPMERPTTSDAVKSGG